MQPDVGHGLRPAKDYASTRYTALDQINNNNVQNLKLARKGRKPSKEII